MTPQEHARDLSLRLAAIKPEAPDDIAKLLVYSFEAAINGERERCAQIAESAVNDMNGQRKAGMARAIARRIRAPQSPHE